MEVVFMKTLFIDTHGELLRIFYVDDDNLVKCEKESQHGHSEIAINTIEEVLKSAKCEVNELDQIIVVVGPGSFTGVRIGVTIAKTIAYTLSIPIKTITSLEMYGVSVEKSFDIIAIKDSKGYYSARYKDGKFCDYSYAKESDFDKYLSSNSFKMLIGKDVNIHKVLDYLGTSEFVNPHLVNPIYIKELNL